MMNLGTHCSRVSNHYLSEDHLLSKTLQETVHDWSCPTLTAQKPSAVYTLKASHPHLLTNTMLQIIWTIMPNPHCTEPEVCTLKTSHLPCSPPVWIWSVNGCLKCKFHTIVGKRMFRPYMILLGNCHRSAQTKEPKIRNLNSDLCPLTLFMIKWFLNSCNWLLEPCASSLSWPFWFMRPFLHCILLAVPSMLAATHFSQFTSGLMWSPVLYSRSVWSELMSNLI